MTGGTTDRESTREAVEAFALLSHETRMAAMRVPWRADEPLRYSEISDRADISDTGNFNYRFGKLVGHSVLKSEDTYGLTQAGIEAMAAVESGGVTEDLPFERVKVSKPCPYCGSDILLHHDGDCLSIVCSTWAGTVDSGDACDSPRQGTLAKFPFPPAGLRDRDPEAVLSAALKRVLSRCQSKANGICPDCAGPIERTVTVCDDHGRTGVCTQCQRRFAGMVESSCRTCQRTTDDVLLLDSLRNPHVRNYFQDHGFGLFDPRLEAVPTFLTAEERVHAVSPIDYEATWNLDGERFSIQFDDSSVVTNVKRGSE